LCSKRGSDSEHEASKRFKAELLVQMDGLGSNSGTNSASSSPGSSSGNNNNGGDESKAVMVLAATNFPWLIDEGFRRRFEKRIYIPLPDAAARRSLIELSLKGMQVEEDVDLDAVAERLQGYSGADISNLCRDAAMMAMRRAIRDRPIEELKNLRREEVDRPIGATDFAEAITRVRNTCSDVECARYEDWMAKHGSF